MEASRRPLGLRLGPLCAPRHSFQQVVLVGALGVDRSGGGSVDRRSGGGRLGWAVAANRTWCRAASQGGKASDRLVVDPPPVGLSAAGSGVVHVPHGPAKSGGPLRRTAVRGVLDGDGLVGWTDSRRVHSATSANERVVLGVDPVRCSVSMVLVL